MARVDRFCGGGYAWCGMHGQCQLRGGADVPRDWLLACEGRQGAFVLRRIAYRMGPRSAVVEGLLTDGDEVCRGRGNEEATWRLGHGREDILG